MSRIVVSEIKEFPGKVYFPDFLTLPQVVAIDEAFEASKGKKRFQHDSAVMPALLACVEKMEIKGQPENPTIETFVYSPSVPASNLIALMITEVTAMVAGETEIPNA